MSGILEEIETKIQGIKTSTAKSNVGVVRETGDEVALIEGLSEVMLNEMIEFPDGIFSLALNLEETEVGAILLGETTKVAEGDEVKTTGKLLQVPVGKALLGRVVNTIGQPLDGKGEVKTDSFYPLEKIAPGVIKRRSVSQPVQTGIMAIDAMIPIGRGQRELIIYDDLSKHAVAYRQVSLVLRRPSGREAYPGDVFYLHSRLLERSARVAEEFGGGSLTALPIIETQAGDVSAYIPTNVISITDGQIFLEADLFRSGVRPAINVGISVSRVGGNAQPKPMKNVAGRLRIDLSQYRDLEAFAQFGSDLDAETQATLNRGERLVEALNQDELSPWPIEDQVAAIYSGTAGYLDRIKVDRIREFHQMMRERLHSENEDLMKQR